MNVERVAAADLFKTEEFRGSPWIEALCERVGEIWVTYQSLPPGHFGTYFGATEVRKYANPYVSDLYWLHELTHVETLVYEPHPEWLDWSADIIDSELKASLVSECYAYLRIPGLREKTFTHRIWVDRFLKKLAPSSDPVELEDEIRTERLRAMHAPGFNDFLEAQIANYYQQNHVWNRIWSEPANVGPRPERPAFRIVEEHMHAPDRDETHQAWIKKHTQIGEWTAPFLAQAKPFAEVYRASNVKYGNHLLTR